jgi:hypothetical protein
MAGDKEAKVEYGTERKLDAYKFQYNMGDDDSYVLQRINEHHQNLKINFWDRWEEDK